MENSFLSSRAFSICSCVEDNMHCFVVIKDGADGFPVFDMLKECEYLEPISCNRKAAFQVDVQSFVDCAIIEVAYREECKLRDLLPIEVVASAEVQFVLNKLNDSRE